MEEKPKNNQKDKELDHLPEDLKAFISKRVTELSGQKEEPPVDKKEPQVQKEEPQVDTVETTEEITEIKEIKDESSSQSKREGFLDEKMKSFLTKNTKELSKVEGNIVIESDNKEVKTILVTSCTAGEGKTTAAISMAYSLATQVKSKVLLIDGNLSSSKIHTYFNINPSPGLTTFLSNAATYKDILHKTEFELLAVVPSGTEASSNLGLLEARKLKEKLDLFKRGFDYIVFDSSSILETSDVTVIARYFDGIILVIECEKTRWEVVQSAKERIISSGGVFLGTVLNKRKYYIPRTLYG